MLEILPSNRVRSTIWLWPIVGVFWVGLIVETWLATPQAMDRNPTYETLCFGFESALVAWMTLCGMWLVFSAESLRRRFTIVIVTALGGLLLPFLASGMPGDGILLSIPNGQSLFHRRYFSETLDLSNLELGLLALSTILLLGFLNRILGNIRFHRSCLPPRSKTMSFSQRLLKAYRTDNQTSRAMMNAESRVWATGLIAWVVLAFVMFQESNLVSVGETATYGSAVALYLFLFVWFASQSLTSVTAGFVLTAGLLPFLFWPWFTRISRLALNDVSEAEVTVTLLVCTIIAFATLASVIMLVFTNKAPRRFAVATAHRSDDWNGSFHNSNDPQTGVLPTRTLVRFSSGFIASGLLWMGCCGFAYWLPRSIDPVVLVRSNPLSISLARFSAQTIACHDGQRTIKHRLSIEEMAKWWSYIDDTANSEIEATVFQYNQSRNRVASEHQLILRKLNSKTDLLIAPLTDLIEDGLVVNVQIVEPVGDWERLEELLSTGAPVHCSVNANHQPLPIDRLSKPNLHILDVYSATDDSATWAFLGKHRSPRGERMFVDCQFPDENPFIPWENVVIFNCQFPTGFLLHQPTLTASRNYVKIVKLRAGQKFAGQELLTFLQNHGTIVSVPPHDSILADDFPRLFVPCLLDRHLSVWQLSARPLLLDSNVTEAVISKRLQIPKLTEVDKDGRLTALWLTASRDCPALPKWNIFPDVRRLHVTLGSQSRHDNRQAVDESFAPESIGFQPHAFPALRSVVFEPSSNVWSDVEHSFVCDLIAAPQLKQITISLPLDQFWTVAEMSNAERLVVDVSTHWNFISRNAPDVLLSWIPSLDQMKNLKEVLILDPSDVSMTSTTNDNSNVFIDFATAKPQQPHQQLTEQWTKQIHAVAPHLTVRIVDEIPDPAKENDELDD